MRAISSFIHLFVHNITDAAGTAAPNGAARWRASLYGTANLVYIGWKAVEEGNFKK